MESTSPTKLADELESNIPWYREMRGYHWFVFLVAALGWLLDCFDQLMRVVSDADQPVLVVCNRTHQAQLMNAHVFHRAYRRANVDWILWFEKDDRYVIEN